MEWWRYKWDMETAEELTEIGTTSIPSVTQKRTLYAIIVNVQVTSADNVQEMDESSRIS
jgi:hypothetical protein